MGVLEIEPTTFAVSPRRALSRFAGRKRREGRYEFGGADGIRTHDLLDAIEARSQLRHGPTGKERQLTFIAPRSAQRQTC
jgi:hypothetical protein